jgi:streptogramin lyase
MRRKFGRFGAVAMCALASCGSVGNGSTSSSERDVANSTPVSVDEIASAPTTDPQPDRPVPAGTWDGALSDGTVTFEARLMMIANCEAGNVCGELEYLDPAHPDSVLCAPQLLYMGIERDEFVFEEQPAYRADQCLPTTLKVRYIDDDTVVIDQFGEPDVACCSGDFDRVSADAPPPTTLPTGAELAGLAGPLSVTDLHGATTQYAAVSASGLWFPVPGAVRRIDPASGAVVATIAAGDASDGFGDPHGVAAAGGTVWVGISSDRSVARIDPATNEIAETIAVEVAPYALAIDGKDLWITSFDADAVVRVDTATGQTTARLDVEKPTGIAVGGGSVWVVQHRLDSLVRIDPSTNASIATIALGSNGDDPTCGMCIENVVFAFDAVWTANNAGRSVTRVDPSTGSTLEIPLEHRVWAVAADGQSVWASQFEPLEDNSFDVEVAGLARIDPLSHTVEQLPLRGAIGVTTSPGSVWATVLGRRSDLLYRYDTCQRPNRVGCSSVAPMPSARRSNVRLCPTSGLWSSTATCSHG